MLGQVDLAFLSAYAVGMFFAGHLGDRTDLRVFLSVGMLGSGLFCCLFGWVSKIRQAQTAADAALQEAATGAAAARVSVVMPSTAALTRCARAVP